MKRIYILLVLGLTSLNCFAQMNKATIQVFDEHTNVMSGVSVRLSFIKLEGVSNKFEDTTDKEGKCTITGYGDGGGIFVYAKKDGYYHSSAELYFQDRFGMRNLGLWKPWHPKFTLYLTKKDNPIPMYAKRVMNDVVPVVDEKIGYDLRMGDWVYSGYKGKQSDIFFCLRDLPPKKVEDNYYITQTTYHRTLTVSFPNYNDGVISVKIPDYRDKGMRMSKIAPENGYTNLFKEVMFDNFTTFDRTENSFIRVNTQTNSEGEVVNANYGKIYDDFHFTPLNNEIDFTYYLNPTPNDRNVECDISTNLIVDLPKDERPCNP